MFHKIVTQTKNSFIKCPREKLPMSFNGNIWLVGWDSIDVSLFFPSKARV